MNNAKLVWGWAGVAVVVVAAAFLLWGGSFWSRPGGGGGTGAPSPSPVAAPKGELMPQFPKELILDSKAVLNGSYSIKYSSSVNQLTAQWNSSSSMQSLFSQYETYFKGNGWTIMSESVNSPAFRSIYATSASANVNVAIAPQGKGSQITISYVAK